MSRKNELEAQRESSMQLTAGGVPARTASPFFGVGPITNMTTDEVDRRMARFEFEAWLEKNYQKLDDQGQKTGPVTTGELDRCMHRGYPADKVVLDMMREIHRYFEFPKQNKMAVGLGGGHSGFTVAVLHLMNTESDFNVFVDTPRPESESAKHGGAFRQSWGALDSTPNPERRAELIERYGSKLILASNTYASLIDGEGLKGPYVD